jgi:4,5-dihydroxyphthalate decarboxylase
MTASTRTLTLNTAVGGQIVFDALKDGTVAVEGATLDFQEVKPITAVFRRMCRTLDWDVAEMAVAAYFVAREHGKPFTALPAIVLGHGQHQNAVYNVESGVRTPKDLEGRKVGVRSYTLTPGIWVRGILKLEHGVDLDTIDWVVGDEEHVAEYASHDPPNVTRQVGADLNRMLAEGELAGGLFAGQGEKVRPFYPDPEAAAREFYKRYGVFPIDHLIVVKDALLREHPWLARALYDALKAAKAEGLRRDPHVHVGGAGIMDGDPLPYGLEANRKALQMLLDFSIEQRVLQKPMTLEQLFPYGFD